ncbi:neural cell adhesion molecule L1-like protein [Sinocyclocheilus grahami]|uniref:neural cell adhesion molecule L1-like protein n=1 Tax=Sinocyclocheilus grahami TaxID=75366 RepID=UPI0007AC8A47|nr:PREDICTED: neural cell adhesion molecule L1-like protein [Sinocyclocheilus grahami]
MRLLWKILLLLGACLNMSCRYQSNALDIPLEVLARVNMEQLPTITEHSPASLIAFPFEESFPVKCEATGNPGTEFRWTKNGQDFDPYQDPRLKTLDDSGTFIIPNNGNLTEFQGNYRCFATNKLGTAMSEEIEFIVPNIPKFPKEIIDPIEVMEGQSVILECNPPKGIPPLQIYWMTISLQHIEQDERVSLGLNGNLYFSNAIETDSRRDYCCFAAFPRIRTIVQKTAMSVVVKSNKLMKDSDSGSGRGYANSLLERKPSLLTPTGKESHTYLVKGEDLHLECIAEGFPTPKVEWVKIGFHKLPERVVVESHGKLLTIEMVNEEDEGKYMCRSKNPHGEVVHYFHVTVEEPPEFEIEPQSQLVTIGADVVIKCVVKANPQPIVVWRVNGRLLNEVPTSNRKVLKDGTISIHNAKPENSAVYQCEATNRHGTILANANIMIMNVPKFPKEIIDPIEVMEGQSVILECNPPKGIPPLEIYWMTIRLQHIELDERVSVGLNGNLYFSNAIKSDSRRDYCCFAAFPRIRTIVQKTAMSVMVKSNKLMKDSGSGRGYANSLLERKPSLLTPTGKESHTYLMKGEDLQLECIAEGFPTPKVEWAKIGYHELPERAEVESHGKLLTVEMVNEEDEGKYMCRAKNPHGEVVHYFHVTVEEPPEFEIEPQSQLVTIGADVVIKCVVKGNPQPSVAWRVNGQPLNDVPTSNRKVLKDGTISIHNAKPENSAVYQCEATNRHGTILANANIMIMNIQPLILTENNLQYMAVEGKGVAMHCKVFSSPTSSITWSKTDSANSVEGERFSVHKNGSLEIHNVMKEDMGEYSCFAQNTEGKVAIAATLEVKDPTRIVDPPHDLRVLVRTTIQFSCQAEFDPSIGDDFEILWEKDGMALNASENARYILDDGVLEIINVSFGDQGFYACVARTPVDQDMAVAQLSVVDVPDPPEDMILSEHNGRSVKLQWIPGDDHNSSITDFYSF